MVHLIFLLSSNCKNCGIKTDWSISGTRVGLNVTFPALFLLTTMDEVIIIRSFIQVVLCALIWLKGLHGFVLHCLVNSCFNTCSFSVLFIRKQRNFLIILEILIRWDTIRLFIRTVLLQAAVTLMWEAASSTPIKVRAAAVFSFKTKFFTYLMDSGEKGHLLIFKEECG